MLLSQHRTARSVTNISNLSPTHSVSKSWSPSSVTTIDKTLITTWIMKFWTKSLSVKDLIKIQGLLMESMNCEITKGMFSVGLTKLVWVSFYQFSKTWDKFEINSCKLLGDGDILDRMIGALDGQRFTLETITIKYQMDRSLMSNRFWAGIKKFEVLKDLTIHYW